MTPTKLLVGQIFVVFSIVILGVWAATQWAASMLGYQAQLGQPWAFAFGVPVYRPWQIFPWWYHYEAYAPEVFDKAGMLAGASGFLACASEVADLIPAMLETFLASDRAFAKARKDAGAGT